MDEKEEKYINLIQNTQKGLRNILTILEVIG
jgi:hypothetical protein